MKVVKSTGLVPVKMLVTALPYKAGEIAGWLPNVAVALVTAGKAVMAEIPGDVETEEAEVAFPAPETPAPEPPTPTPHRRSR